ncbi:DapH/DapD/GlmU-related protein [Chryseolinea lacunae]|uniref:LpxA family transferase n=1 Tax=Chryseolinea lacunae TaxID=2801331 RepID=A0ABS1KLJ9_9BACT|nr:DapH/DapD/GlmU-related protein [Chryseolinea lacunae]MBL0740113.1 LpxA family transferase [Chryseolinea lacunae]
MNDNPVSLPHYLRDFTRLFPDFVHTSPWELCSTIQAVLTERIKHLSSDYHIHDDVAIHKSARIEDHVVLKGPLIVSEGCFLGAHAYLRGGVYLGERVSIGPGCEIKSSYVLPGSALAHFNFLGDSVVGSGVNLEAGSIVCNHFNERADKKIFVIVNGKKVDTGSIKFGALIGDDTRIGANAVLSPGTLLEPKSIVKRLELVEQDKNA